MKEIYEKIVSAFDADVDLSAMFPTGIFNDEGFDSPGLPICIISGISEVPTYTTCDEITDLTLQFTIFTTTDSQCFDALAFLKAEFDDKKFTFSNIYPILMTRVAATPPRKIEDAWRTTVDYSIMTQKDR